MKKFILIGISFFTLGAAKAESTLCEKEIFEQLTHRFVSKIDSPEFNIKIDEQNGKITVNQTEYRMIKHGTLSGGIEAVTKRPVTISAPGEGSFDVGKDDTNHVKAKIKIKNGWKNENIIVEVSYPLKPTDSQHMGRITLSKDGQNKCYPEKFEFFADSNRTSKIYRDGNWVPVAHTTPAPTLSGAR